MKKSVISGRYSAAIWSDWSAYAVIPRVRHSIIAEFGGNQFKNRIILATGPVMFLLGALLDLQKSEKFM